MALHPFLPFLFLVSPAFSEGHFIEELKPIDPTLAMQVMKLHSKLLNAFDKRNYDEFMDFDREFVLWWCNTDYTSTQFIELAKKYRDSLPSGTIIKYALTSAQETRHGPAGPIFRMHYMVNGDHQDFEIGFEKHVYSTGIRWRWGSVTKIGCWGTTRHGPVPDDNLHTKVIS